MKETIILKLSVGDLFVDHETGWVYIQNDNRLLSPVTTAVKSRIVKKHKNGKPQLN